MINILRLTAVLGSGLLLLPVTRCTAQHRTTPSDAETGSLVDSATSGEIEVVVRFSKGLFESVTRQDVEMTIPLNRCVEGIPTRGTIVGKGRTHIQLATSDTYAQFTIDVPGTANASFSGDAGPATAYASAIVSFNADKKISFDGKRFYQGPTATSTQSRTRVNQICPRRSGPVGRLVKRVGWCIAGKKICEINQMVDQVAKEILVETFDDAAADVITELNQTTRFEETVDKYFPETKSHIIHLATRPDYILAGAGAPDAAFPDLPPPKAHIEVWLKTRPLEAAFLEMLAEWNLAHDALREFLPDDEAKEIADDVAVETIDGWSVIRVGIEEDQSTKENPETTNGSPKSSD